MDSKNPPQSSKGPLDPSPQAETVSVKLNQGLVKQPLFQLVFFRVLIPKFEKFRLFSVFIIFFLLCLSPSSRGRQLQLTSVFFLFHVL